SFEDFDDLDGAELSQSLTGDPSFEMPDASFMNREQMPYNSPRSVEFRGDFKPELVQLISKVKQNKSQDSGKATPLSPEMLEKLFDKSTEIDISEMNQGELDASSGMFVSNIMKEAATAQDAQDPIWEKPNLAKGNALRGDPLEKDEPLAFLYNEWDFRARDYKPRWCRVRQKTMEEGEAEFYDKTLEAYSGLASQVKKQFELINPETLRKVKKLPDGEEFDLDAVIEALVESKAGVSPSEKLYWRRNKAQRDVAVVFLLDMSASTAEAIDEERQRMDDRNLPDDPRQYIAWLRTQRQGGGVRSYKRIIDVEKESIVLLIKALETIGDAYGIYGFSGYGRENVEFYVIKDIEDAFSDKVKKRIDKIAPVHATRMGAAIRHAISKLEKREAKTKILFLISDGRPQDHGYSRDGMEKEHALHDTKMALLEAKRTGITPFCLTVDKAGHDYLKTMCQDVAYEVVSEIESLPKRLPALYRKLTA
ncbi:MAG: VWA domain-containing protein, partial [Dehalococcoidia bacterium]|nr:VWA domain-containing protein [Dehalococcoidia bacterium]